MSKVDEIIRAEANKEISTEEANKQPEAIGSKVRINPDKNVIPTQEMAATEVM